MSRCKKKTVELNEYTWIGQDLHWHLLFLLVYHPTANHTAAPTNKKNYLKKLITAKYNLIIIIMLIIPLSFSYALQKSWCFLFWMFRYKFQYTEGAAKK